MSFDPDTLKPRRTETARPQGESEAASGGGAPLAHKIEKSIDAVIKIEQQGGITSEVALVPDSKEMARQPQDSHHHGLEAAVDKLEHAVHRGIF